MALNKSLDVRRGQRTAGAAAAALEQERSDAVELKVVIAVVGTRRQEEFHACVAEHAAVVVSDAGHGAGFAHYILQQDGIAGVSDAEAHGGRIHRCGPT